MQIWWVGAPFAVPPTGTGGYVWPVFAPAVPVPVPVPPLGVHVEAIRRVRRAPWVQTDRRWLFHERFQLDLEAGVGLDGTTGTPGTHADPVLALAWSDDRGATWQTPREATAGRLGLYRHRALWRRLGRSRQRVYEVSSSEPVKMVWIRAFVQADPGTF